MDAQLSAWWVRLGVLPEFIEPGKPQQNGRHERMHRTLKAETTRPAAANLAAQQRKFNTFRQEFNQQRPHEALDRVTLFLRKLQDKHQLEPQQKQAQHAVSLFYEMQTAPGDFSEMI